MSGSTGDVVFSRLNGDSAMHLLWALAPRCPQLVLEANFRTQSAFERGQVTDLIRKPGARVVEIFCRVPLEEATRRFAERARLERHHPAHALTEMSLEQLAVYSQPFALSPVIEIDTSVPVDVDALLARVRAALEAESPDGG
jgi:hypothetical protein